MDDVALDDLRQLAAETGLPEPVDASHVVAGEGAFVAVTLADRADAQRWAEALGATLGEDGTWTATAEAFDPDRPVERVTYRLTHQ